MAISTVRKAQLFDDVINWLIYPPMLNNVGAMDLACTLANIGLSTEEAREVMQDYSYSEEDIEAALQENYDYYGEDEQ